MTFNIVKKADISSEGMNHHSWYSKLTILSLKDFSATYAAPTQRSKTELDTQWLFKHQQYFAPPLVFCCRQQPMSFLK